MTWKTATGGLQKWCRRHAGLPMKPESISAFMTWTTTEKWTISTYSLQAVMRQKEMVMTGYGPINGISHPEPDFPS